MTMAGYLAMAKRLAAAPQREATTANARMVIGGMGQDVKVTVLCSSVINSSTIIYVNQLVTRTMSFSLLQISMNAVKEATHVVLMPYV